MTSLAFDSKYKGGLCYVACQELFALYENCQSAITPAFYTAEEDAISEQGGLMTQKKEKFQTTCARDTLRSYI
jgi:hypothetical protein